MDDFSQTLLAAAQARRAQSIAFLGKLIAAQRSGEAAVQQCFADHLAEAGCQVESLHYAPAKVQMQHEFATGDLAATEERCSLIARLKGEGAGRSLIFFGHPDGEPVKNVERWKHDPFAATLSEGRISWLINLLISSLSRAMRSISFCSR